MRTKRLLLCGGVWLGLACGLCLAQQTRTELPDELKIVPDMKPLPALEVVTVRKAEPDPPRTLLATTMKAYILNAYSMSPQQGDRLVGAPSWVASQIWVINGKNTDELNAQLKTMPREQQALVGQMLRRSVLADQFQLKTHVETRQMQYYELVLAKGGLKVKEVPAFVPPPPGSPRPAFVPGVVPPGAMMISVNGGKTVINAHAITLSQLSNLMMAGQEVGGRPIVNKTGFKGSFDLKDLQWAGVPGMMNGGGAPPPPADVDAPSMFTALEETLGVKLVAVKGPVEVLVIDSITEPTEN